MQYRRRVDVFTNSIYKLRNKFCQTNYYIGYSFFDSTH